MDPGNLLEHCLLLDLETAPDGRILKVGAVLGPTAITPPPSMAATALEGMATQARAVLGHNLLRHDWRILREAHPGHPLLRLPVIDTLVLSPLCFPENPYHHLVKDYKLVRESLNDPVADARLAGRLFQDECRSLAGLSQTDPCTFAVLRSLLTRVTPEDAVWEFCAAEGMEQVFGHLGGPPACPSSDLSTRIAELFRRAGCRHVPVDPALLATPAQRHTVAFALAWLRVAGSNSVLPSWVRLQYPGTQELLRRLRDTPCGQPDCDWCSSSHDPEDRLKAFFGYAAFRALPQSPEGTSLQRDIVVAGMRGESILAILPTGGGKSLCYQLPALVRNQRLGSLTLVISPLQALMKDQVDGLVRRTGSASAAAVYGLLTSPERADVLNRVRLGDISILYLSPEQLRNRSLRDALAQREIGCWVFDEAHCLSKWGHDFRPDYLYAGRFIREFSAAHGTSIPPIACFTATAKQEVREEILVHFRAETGRDLRVFEGGVDRDNLAFEVVATPTHAKFERLHDLLSARLGDPPTGTAMVFHARRARAEAAAAYLSTKGWAAAHFHAGLTPPEKKRIQDGFLAGETRVICATNAFGMGIDKEDVRLVIHADTPGSLENYLQEAGRAGRDGAHARCVLLFDEADCEAQFRLGAASELTRRDIARILQSLRHRAARGQREDLVVTTGEILRDEALDLSFEPDQPDADTRVRTAIAWLERGGFLRRDENITRVFQARALVANLAEADARIASLDLSRSEQTLWHAVLRELLNAPKDASLTIDSLALLPEFTAYARAHPDRAADPEHLSRRILGILGSMARAGLLERDTLLNAFLRYKVTDHCELRLERVVRLEQAVLDALALQAPDPEGWLPLSLRLLAQHLATEGVLASRESIRDVLRSLAEDGRGFAGSHGSIEMRHFTQDTYRLRIRRSWTRITELSDRRRRVAAAALGAILNRIPPGTPPGADRLVAFAFEDIRRAIDQDLLLRSELRDPESAIARALLYLHEQQVLQLQQGLALFRSAMTLRFLPERGGDSYLVADYRPLEHHYRERILQVHVMGEYARRGLRAIREARELVLAYFSQEKSAFLRRFLPGQEKLLAHATTAASYQRIVSDLDNQAQIRIVTAPAQRNLLVLAGPGSGKTRTVVHRCAYLLRVARIPGRSILVCCFNRSAALELRHRLVELVGDDARSVTVLTYHGLALRLLGTSSTPIPGATASEPDFDRLILDAVQLLETGTVPSQAPSAETQTADDVRDRLLAGFQYILVDEYQDIDEPQYRMIRALTGGESKDPDRRLSILAVGDDDQNIYAFRGTNVRFIRQFQQDYQAEAQYLVENYRATQHLIDVSNTLIAANRDRMKTEHAIRIDAPRITAPRGGRLETFDPLTQGRVQILQLEGLHQQPAAVVDELRRLESLGFSPFREGAVLSRTHRELAAIRAACEMAGIPVRWPATRQALPPLQRIRELAAFLDVLRGHAPAPGTPLPSLCRASTLLDLALASAQSTRRPDNPWFQLLRSLLEAWRLDSFDAELPLPAAVDWLHEALTEARAEFHLGEGVTLSTVHAAKGTEFRHVVLAGAWVPRPDRSDEEELRRALYVGCTRARESLTLLDVGHHPLRLTALPPGPSVLHRRPTPTPPQPPPTREPITGYAHLGPEDIVLGWAGHFPPGHPVHQHLAELEPGDRLHPVLRPPPTAPMPQVSEAIPAPSEPMLELTTDAGQVVARLSRKAARQWIPRLHTVREIRVLCLFRRHANQTVEEAYRSRLVLDSWEVPVAELVLGEPDAGS